MSSGNTREEAPASRTPQRRRGRERVAALQAAAASLFLEKGYEATTMTEIAARAGSSIGSLYLFFPTKPLLAQTMMTEIAEALSERLDALRARVQHWSAAEIGDALFGELALFLEDHPVYTVLIELRRDDSWRHAMKARRRGQIAALFTLATPPLPKGQPERLAMIVPELMRITMVLSGQPGLPLRGQVLEELRAMLRHHLEAGINSAGCSRTAADPPASRSDRCDAGRG